MIQTRPFCSWTAIPLIGAIQPVAGVLNSSLAHVAIRKMGKHGIAPFSLADAPSAASTNEAHANSIYANHIMTPVVFRLFWCFIFVYHLFNAMFILGLSGTHILISQPAVYENVWLIRISRTTLAVAGWSLLTVAILHIAAVVHHLFQSVVSRRFMFSSDGDIAQGPSSSSLTTTRLESTIRSVLRYPIKFGESIFGEKGLLGIRGEYFYVMFYVRQVIKIVLQTYQVYQVSLSVPRRWINRFSALCVVVNCIYVPSINVALRNHPGPRRTTLLMADIFLDFILAVILPILVLYPRASEYNWVKNRYDENYICDDVWMASALGEARHLLVSSHLDFVSTLFPHLTGLLTLDTLKSTLQKAATEYTRKKTVQRGPSLAVALSADQPAVVPVKKAKIVYYMIAIPWVFFVMSCDGYAKRHVLDTAADASCRLLMGPWFATNVTCAVVYVNCYGQNLTGASDEITGVLSKMERSTLSRLIISHCSAVSIPPILTEFQNLNFIELFNSTLMDWSMEAALTDTAMPALSQLHFVGTNFTEFPVGILHDHLPLKLSLLFYHNNMAELPDVFGDLWLSHTWPYFHVEHTQLASLPPSFSHIRATWLALLSTQLQSLPDKLASTPFTSLQFSQNNITTLPSLIGDTSGIYQVLAQNTSIETLPVWFHSWYDSRRYDPESLTVVSFKGSPLCTDETYHEICQDISVIVGGEYRYDIVALHREL